jgi:anti-anti-sigma factor
VDESFRADLVEDEGEVRLLLGGDIDVAVVPEFFSRMQEADRASKGAVIVVMHDVSLIDSSGLGVLARLAAAGVEMQICGAQGVVRRALEISGSTCCRTSECSELKLAPVVGRGPRGEQTRDHDHR